jgi:multiple sugar transport system permease protein
MLLAALQSLPNDYYEAAAIEGCTGVKAFFLITLPSIKSTVVMTLLLRVIWVFNNADMIYVMTKGGPANTSHTLASFMFTKAYSTLDFGMASAIGVIFMLVLGVFAIFFMRVTKYHEAGSL